MAVTVPTGFDTSFITFDATNRLVKWSTTDNSKAEIYTIQITGTISALLTWT
jgi:hypothetical protein